ncbi:SDR family NAD(P)-dependent oxidoreductase [Streptomyces sp. NPDC048106]|uniref:SDR family NAD(P)-dependent oxidoreductase n=1 Tax=Streptomyces sp. NPDC048106 TaxID=3155750 RepID=UPI003454DD26
MPARRRTRGWADLRPASLSSGLVVRAILAVPRPSEYRGWVRAPEHVRPADGVDYDQVATERLERSVVREVLGERLPSGWVLQKVSGGRGPEQIWGRKSQKAWRRFSFRCISPHFAGAAQRIAWARPQQSLWRPGRRKGSRGQQCAIDVLVNNAGLSAIGGLMDHELAAYRGGDEVNYLGAPACTLAALPALARARGRIVVMSPVAGFAPVLGRPAYVGAKHAVTGGSPRCGRSWRRRGSLSRWCIRRSWREAWPRSSVRRVCGGPPRPGDHLGRRGTRGAQGGGRRPRPRTGRQHREAGLAGEPMAPRLYTWLMARRLRGAGN